MKAYLLAAGGLIAAGLYFGLREAGEAQARAKLLTTESGRRAVLHECQKQSREAEAVWSKEYHAWIEPWRQRAKEADPTLAEAGTPSLFSCVPRLPQLSQLFLLRCDEAAAEPDADALFAVLAQRRAEEKARRRAKCEAERMAEEAAQAEAQRCQEREALAARAENEAKRIAREAGESEPERPELRDCGAELQALILDSLR